MLSKEYGLDRAKVFKDIALPDARRAIQSKEVSALLVVIPLAEKYLSLVRDFFQQGPKALPVLIPIDSAGAIAQAERAYESFDVPKGTLRGSPPVPDDDLTTLRTSLYLVANKKLGADLITSLTLAIMSVRRDLMGEQPIFAQITAPSTDADAYLPLHPGAAAVYNGTQQSFMDEYGNWIYLTPMVLGGAATVLAAAWKFLGLGEPANGTKARWILSMPWDAGFGRPAPRPSCRISRKRSTTFSEAQRARSAGGDESAVDDATLNVAAHRLESLIHDRRTMLAKRPGSPPQPEAESAGSRPQPPAIAPGSHRHGQRRVVWHERPVDLARCFRGDIRRRPARRCAFGHCCRKAICSPTRRTSSKWPRA